MRAAKILIVEDERVVAWHVQEALYKLGHHVVGIATTAKEAFQYALDQPPDLVLMDICLQGSSLDGVSAAEYLYLQLDVPVVYLTAHADQHTLRRATETSPFGYLVKPFQEVDLHSTIQIALRRHQLEQALKAVQQWYATTLISIGDATIATDVDGFVAFLNPTAEILTGWTQEQALGAFASQVLDLVDEDTGAAIDNPILAALCQGDTITLPSRALLRSRDGSVHPVGDSASPIRNRKGEIIGGVMVFQDISDRRCQEQTLQKQNQVLEQSQDQLTAQLWEQTVQLQQAIACTQLLKRVLERFASQSAEECAEEPSFNSVSTWVSRNSVLHLLLQEVGQVLDVEYCWVALQDADQRFVTIAYEHRPTDRGCKRSAIGEQIYLEDFSRFYLRLMQHQFWINPSPEVLPSLYQSFLDAKSQLIVCPIQDDQRVIGEIGIVMRHLSTQSPLQGELIAQTVNQAAIALYQTQRHQAAQAQVRELQRLNVLKDEFLQALSRELRTPLTNMRMAVEMVQRIAQMLKTSSLQSMHPDATEALWGKFDRYLQILQQEWQDECELVNNLLDFQSTAALAQALPSHSLYLQLWLPEVVNRFQEEAKRKQQFLNSRIADDLPAIAVHSPTLDRLLTELLKNACQFTPPEHVIQVAAQAHGGQLELSVSNTGTELSSAEQMQIFEPFYRSANEGWSGFGLGLALVKRLAIALKGQIRVESESNQTRFVLTLPITQDLA
ncbi:MAG: response regulator [Myxacorys californica WJT36-NPBG1]|nr:response regulator [Myxacorys californica WJT36-NPBG1]